jgi:hypothetical protein
MESPKYGGWLILAVNDAEQARTWLPLILKPLQTDGLVSPVQVTECVTECGYGDSVYLK